MNSIDKIKMTIIDHIEMLKLKKFSELKAFPAHSSTVFEEKFPISVWCDINDKENFVQVVVQGYIPHRVIPGVGRMYCVGFHKYSDESVVELEPNDLYEFT